MSNPNRPGRTPMPEQDPKVRARNFLEVPLGYTEEMARREASRCLKCKTPMCRTGCPVGVKIPEFLALIAEGDFLAAAAKIKETNALPAICGRVCPQENQCEGKCILGRKFEPVAIGRCERFAADYERQHGGAAQNASYKSALPQSNGKKVAVIGAGPSGLTVAGDLVRLGYAVTIFEAFHKPGGVLSYGIPEFRLPKAIVEAEIENLRKMGVQIECNTLVGKTVTVDELLEEEGFSAVFIGVGAGLPMFLGVPGEDLGNICSANEYLTRSNLMKAYLFPEYDTPIIRGKNVCVVGGGNVAMDAARSAMRLGAETVTIVYRRSESELPARAEEVHHAKEEGICFRLLTNPVAFHGDERGKVRAMTVQKMELGEPDASGRRRPIPIADSEYEIPTDLVLIATGTRANPVLTGNTPNLGLTPRGYIVSHGAGRTSRPGVWAGGDIVTGAATVILAMGAGREASKDIHQWLSEGGAWE